MPRKTVHIVAHLEIGDGQPPTFIATLQKDNQDPETFTITIDPSRPRRYTFTDWEEPNIEGVSDSFWGAATQIMDSLDECLRDMIWDQIPEEIPEL